jgi:FtsP/CotA-like multicopper oxidase with cupredoxin domain
MRLLLTVLASALVFPAFATDDSVVILGLRISEALALTLDDVLIEDGRVGSFDANETNYSAMGRFGNTMLTGGEIDLALTVRRDEVVRFYLTNTANTRVFNVAVPGTRMKLVGGDSGHVEHEWFERD